MAIDWGKYWSRVNLGADFSWKIDRNARKQLAKITNFPETLFDGTPPEVNQRLREFVGPLLLQGGEIKDRLCSWIVESWGGIKSHNKHNFAKLIADFGDFSVPSIWKVANQYGTQRISSWSKLAAFAHLSTAVGFQASVAE